MTNTEAFKQAMELIEKNKLNNTWWETKPFEAFLIPQRTIWLWFRICDYFVVNGKYPKSYRSLHAWEKKYFENNM